MPFVRMGILLALVLPLAIICFPLYISIMGVKYYATLEKANYLKTLGIIWITMCVIPMILGIIIWIFNKGVGEFLSTLFFNLPVLILAILYTVGATMNKRA